jgi:hypothetical protein
MKEMNYLKNKKLSPQENFNNLLANVRSYLHDRFPPYFLEALHLDFDKLVFVFIAFTFTRDAL